MKVRKVIANNNMPVRLPIWSSITALIALEHWNAPQWVYGATGLFFLIIWIASIILLIVEEKTDIFNDNK
jgi:hypothetical protein